MLAGLSCGVGNYIMGVKLGHMGLLGPGFTGPIGLFIVLAYRMIQMVIEKCKTG